MRRCPAFGHDAPLLFSWMKSITIMAEMTITFFSVRTGDGPGVIRSSGSFIRAVLIRALTAAPPLEARPPLCAFRVRSALDGMPRKALVMGPRGSGHSFNPLPWPREKLR